MGSARWRRGALEALGCALLASEAAAAPAPAAAPARDPVAATAEPLSELTSPLPQGPAPSLPSESPAAPGRIEKLGLRQAVDRALERNPTALVAAADIRRAEALVRETRATSLPTLTGNASYTRLDADRMRGEMVVAEADQLSANAVLAVPLAAPQRWMSWLHASDNVDVATANAAEVRRQLALSTARAWLSVVAQRRIVEVSARARNAAQAHADFAQAQLDGGVGTRIDVVRARQEVATSSAQLETGRGALVRVQEALGLLTGSGARADATGDELLPAAPPDEARALDEAASQRTDIAAQRARVVAAEHLVRDGWADYLPTLTGSFELFAQHPASLSKPTTGWQAMLSLSVPFYDGGLRYGLADERDALLSQAEAQLTGLERQAKSEARTALEALRRAEAALGSAREAARLAEEALALATEAYQAGASTNIEVIDAERRARDAQTAAVVAEDSARQAKLDLLVASGRFP